MFCCSSTEEIFSALKKTVVSVFTVQRWFTKFRSRNFSVQDMPRSGRPIDIKDDEMKGLVDENPQSIAQ